MSVDRHVELAPAQRHLKRLCGRLIAKVGGYEAAANYCRLGKSQLSDCCHANVLAFLPLDAIEDLESVAGEPIVTRHLAAAQRHGLVRLPDPGSLGTKFARLIGALGKEAGDLTNGICIDLDDDNDVSPEEAEKRLSDAADLVRVAVEIEASLKARAEGQW